MVSFLIHIKMSGFLPSRVKIQKNNDAITTGGAFRALLRKKLLKCEIMSSETRYVEIQ